MALGLAWAHLLAACSSAGLSDRTDLGEGEVLVATEGQAAAIAEWMWLGDDWRMHVETAAVAPLNVDAALLVETCRVVETDPDGFEDGVRRWARTSTRSIAIPPERLAGIVDVYVETVEARCEYS